MAFLAPASKLAERGVVGEPMDLAASRS